MGVPTTESGRRTDESAMRSRPGAWARIRVRTPAFGGATLPAVADLPVDEPSKSRLRAMCPIVYAETTVAAPIRPASIGLRPLRLRPAVLAGGGTASMRGGAATALTGRHARTNPSRPLSTHPRGRFGTSSARGGPVAWRSPLNSTSAGGYISLLTISTGLRRPVFRRIALSGVVDSSICAPRLRANSMTNAKYSAGTAARSSSARTSFRHGWHSQCTGTSVTAHTPAAAVSATYSLKSLASRPSARRTPSVVAEFRPSSRVPKR